MITDDFRYSWTLLPLVEHTESQCWNERRKGEKMFYCHLFLFQMNYTVYVCVSLRVDVDVCVVMIQEMSLDFFQFICRKIINLGRRTALYFSQYDQET